MKNPIDIETVLRELYTVSGCRVSIHDSEYTEIAAYPHELSRFCRMVQSSPAAYMNCLRGDAEALSLVRRTESPYIYRCHMGLFEAVAPLYHAGVLTGYLMMGQLAERTDHARDDLFSRALSTLPDSGYTEEELGAAVADVLDTTQEMFSSFVNIMSICAEYITLSGRLDLPARDLAHMVKKYIHQNYTRAISLDELCDTFRCSKSTLMNAFRGSCHTTIGKYATDVRLSHAKRMLSETDAPVRHISAACGFSDQGYFTKVFSAATGMAPTEFRRQIHAKEAPTEGESAEKEQEARES